MSRRPPEVESIPLSPRWDLDASSWAESTLPWTPGQDIPRRVPSRPTKGKIDGPRCLRKAENKPEPPAGVGPQGQGSEEPSGGRVKAAPVRPLSGREAISACSALTFVIQAASPGPSAVLGADFRGVSRGQRPQYGIPPAAPPRRRLPVRKPCLGADVRLNAAAGRLSTPGAWSSRPGARSGAPRASTSARYVLWGLHVRLAVFGLLSGVILCSHHVKAVRLRRRKARDTDGRHEVQGATATSGSTEPLRGAPLAPRSASRSCCRT